jgi:hypothetical protein
VTLEELRVEFRNEVIGPKWLETVQEVCRQTTRSYPANIYGGTESWADSMDDLVQDVITNALIRDHQLEYLMDEAQAMGDLRRLLGRQVRHVLARRRIRTVVDQLLDRSRVILRQPPFVQLANGKNARWTLDDRPFEDRSPNPGELRCAEIGVRGVSIVPYAGSERAPIIYREESLRQLLQGLARSMPCPFGLRDLDRIFRNVLTGFLPGVLDGVGGPQGPPTDPEDASEMRRTANQVYEQLEPVQRQVLAAKLIGVSDSDVAWRLAISRPTAAKRKMATFEIVREAAEHLTDDARGGMVDELGNLLVGIWPPQLGGGDEVA